jgi:hypothetical protein
MKRTMSNNTHVTDVGRLVHERPDLIYYGFRQLTVLCTLIAVTANLS